jgi:cysteine synthase A
LRAKGYPLVLTMAEPFSVERRKLMRFLGAKVIVTPAAQRAVGMVNKAAELAKAHGWFMTRQFENEANPDIHTETTAREILDDFSGERLDYWVTGYGTGGTLKGVARVLAKERPDTRIVVCEPVDAQLLGSGIEQSRNDDGTPAGPHPTFKPHPMQGWTPDFIPKLTADAVATKVISPAAADIGRRCHQVQQGACDQGRHLCRDHFRRDICRALQVAAEAEAGANILCMLPDTGERYLSTPLFADVSADMNEEELEISRSTPGAQLGS